MHSLHVIDKLCMFKLTSIYISLQAFIMYETLKLNYLFDKYEFESKV